jgi:8-oxo-dGTP pyrophosphatase MutT (NUDIX family)
VVTDGEGRVLLLEHTYVHGWHLPGGGVDQGESCEAAVVRELVEEAGIRALERPVLLSVHDNGASFPGDHVLLFRIDRWTRTEATARNEITRTGFFDPRDLPPGVTRGTRARLAEVFGGTAPDARW